MEPNEIERLVEICQIILLNATVIADPAMKGWTDTYSVPLDDIETLRKVLGYEASQFDCSLCGAHAKINHDCSKLYEFANQRMDNG